MSRLIAVSELEQYIQHNSTAVGKLDSLAKEFVHRLLRHAGQNRTTISTADVMEALDAVVNTDMRDAILDRIQA